MYRIAGEIVSGGDKEIDEPLVGQVLEGSYAASTNYIVPNFCALVANTPGRTIGPAITLMLAKLDYLAKTWPISRLVVLSSFSRRVLNNEQGDQIVIVLRKALLPVLKSYLSPQREQNADKVLGSMAWCYMTAFHKKFNTACPETQWPALTPNDETQERNALAMLCEITDIPFKATPRRSLQLAFVEFQDGVLVGSYSPLSVVHYLYYLVVAQKHQAVILEVQYKLHEIFSPGSKIEGVYRNHPLSEVGQLFEICRQIYQSESDLNLNPA